MQDLAIGGPPDAEPSCIECGMPRSKSSRQKLARGRCHNCYRRHLQALKAAGTFEAPKPAAEAERLFSRGEPGPGGCILWTGCVTSNGYGRFSRRSGETRYAHRVAYELIKGQIPAEMVIDHACHNIDPECPGGACFHRRCINPEHLEVVTQSENRVRSPFTKGITRTHCLKGHEYTSENVMVGGNGRRSCRTCYDRRTQEYAAKRRAAKKAAKS